MANPLSNVNLSSVSQQIDDKKPQTSQAGRDTVPSAPSPSTSGDLPKDRVEMEGALQLSRAQNLPSGGAIHDTEGALAALEKLRSLMAEDDAAGSKVVGALSNDAVAILLSRPPAPDH